MEDADDEKAQLLLVSSTISPGPFSDVVEQVDAVNGSGNEQ